MTLSDVFHLTKIILLSQTPAQEADKIKNEGNTFFRSGDYNEAIRCYTEAIAKCPEKDTNLKSTFFQNKAAAYERLVNFLRLFGLENLTTNLISNIFFRTMQRKLSKIVRLL